MNIIRDAQERRIADSACGNRIATGQIVCCSSCGAVATKALVVENWMKTAIFRNRNEECSNGSFEEVDGTQPHNKNPERLPVFCSLTLINTRPSKPTRKTGRMHRVGCMMLLGLAALRS